MLLSERPLHVTLKKKLLVLIFIVICRGFFSQHDRSSIIDGSHVSAISREQRKLLVPQNKFH